MTHPDLGDPIANELVSLRVAALPPPRVDVDPRFVEVDVTCRIVVTNGPKPRTWTTWVARFAWRRDAHGGAAAEASTPEEALSKLASRMRSTRAPWQEDGRAVEVLVRIEGDVDTRTRRATGCGATVGEAIDAALEALRGGTPA